MKEMYLEFYKIYDKYHDTKERMVWLASTVYLGFGFAAIDWLVRNRSAWNVAGYRWMVYVGAIVVAIFSIAFARTQNWYKARAVEITGKLDELLLQFEDGKEPTPWELQRAIGYPGNLCFWQKRAAVWRNGKAGLLAIGLMLATAIFQLILVCKLSDP